MLAQEESTAEVRFEDQQKINEFGRLVERKNEIKDLKELLKKEIDSLDDASAEMMMCEDGAVMLMVGESYVEVSEDVATEKIEELLSDKQKEMENLETELKDLEDRQGELKKVLYGRFGKSINLEE